MAFKMVTDSEKRGGRIAGMAKAHAEQMTAEQVRRWRGWLPDDAEDVGIGQIQRFYAVKLRRLCRALTRAEKAHIRQLTAIKLLRRQRDEAAAQVRLKADRLEKVLQGRHGKTFAEVTLEEASEIADPVALRRVALRVAKNLVDPGLRVPEPLVSGTEIDFSDLAWEIAEPAGRLSAHLDELDDELPVLSRTLERKIRSLDAVKDLTKRLARFLEGLYGLEGNDTLQAKVKQALKIARKTVDAVERSAAAEAKEGEIAEARDPGTEPADEAGDARAEAEVAEIAGKVTAEDEDGRLRKIGERLALRDDPMAAFEEGMREAEAEAAAYRAKLQEATRKAAAQEAAVEEAASREAAPPEAPPPGAAATPERPPDGAGGASERGSDSAAGERFVKARSTAERSSDDSGPSPTRRPEESPAVRPPQQEPEDPHPKSARPDRDPHAS